MLEIRSITKSFAGVQVLKELSLDIHRGEIFTLLGASGCGKTTLLRILAGLERPDQGRLYFNGQSWVDTAANLHVPPQKRGLGLVFQSYAVWPHLSVYDNVAYPLRNLGRGKAEIQDKVMATLEIVGLAGYAKRAAHQLSGGQQQRVAMARALVNDPALLLLDEPFSNLDVSLRKQLRHELKALQERLQLTVVLVTHDQEDAFALSDRIAVMHGGRVEQIGSSEEIHDNPATPFVQSFIGRGSLLAARLSAADEARIGETRIRLAKPVDLPTDSPVGLWVRPQGLALVDAASAPAGALSGEVMHSIFAGDRYETQVRLSDDQTLLAYQSREQLSAPGARVSIVFTTSPHASALATQV
jgi:ABC-type Fe3+/spermidine/putrescine transport system ATPase subunit